MLPGALAIQMGTVAIGYAAFALTGSATALGGVSLATGLPMLALSLVGGVVADRSSRRAILIGTQTILGLGALTTGALALTDQLVIWHLYVLGAVQGTAFSFNMPARQAFVAELVPATLLRSAVTLSNASMNFARIAGPSIAGGLLAIPVVGVGGVFAAMSAMYGAVLVSLARLPERASNRAPGNTRGWDQLTAGLHHIRSTPTLVALLTVGFIPLLLGMPYQTLLPVFAERVHNTGAFGLGLMNAAAGIGALAGSMTVALAARLPWLSRLQVLLGVGFGLSLVGFGAAPSFTVALALLVLVGFTFAAYTALNMTLVMERAAPQFHGRVMSVYLASFGLLPVATFPEAWIADHVGAPATIAGAGALVVITLVLAAVLVPAYRRAG
jgi:MFS family permease